MSEQKPETKQIEKTEVQKDAERPKPRQASHEESGTPVYRRIHRAQRSVR